ncbi:tail assembly protein [Pseudomonas chlororaphis]|uniref:tail assembly protein n=1 Tax=Pseudomonas chlororaphis TaxID=587753 RepID=UPI00215B65E0|nr:tail assembly protein [Pseudomonas chlororaphis]UVE46841.1 tail assembly protein [Pseudomonas chlororaphis]
MASAKVRTIRLYGVLGARFGRVHRLAVNSASEAIRALGILVPGFERFLMDSRDRGLTYSVFMGKENITQDRLRSPVGRDDIRIAPVIIGSKRAGSLQTIVGAVLVVAGLVITGGSFGSAAPFGSALISMGASMMVGGVMQMLSPQPKGLAAQDSPDNRPSYSFNGAVNTSAQGNPVGVLYGQLIVGSAVISAGIYTQDQL